MTADKPRKLPALWCENCWKPESLCLCAGLTAPLQTRTRLLLLQHPQEVRSPLGTARLTSLSLKNGVHRVGLSWRSLSQALGVQVDPSRWAVLYAGTRKETKALGKEPFRVTDRNGEQISPKTIQGIVVLDANWKQAKALWWRNPWLLKLPRLQINPSVPSKYAELRRQPRKQYLSTLEATAAALETVGEPRLVVKSLFERMEEFVGKVRQGESDRERDVPPADDSEHDVSLPMA